MRTEPEGEWTVKSSDLRGGYVRLWVSYVVLVLRVGGGVGLVLSQSLKLKDSVLVLFRFC